MPATLVVDADTVARVKALFEKHWKKRQWMYDRTEKFTTEEVEAFLRGERAMHSDEEKRAMRFTPRDHQFYHIALSLKPTLHEDGTPAEKILHAEVLADQVYYLQKRIGLVS